MNTLVGMHPSQTLQVAGSSPPVDQVFKQQKIVVKGYLCNLPSKGV